MRPSREYVPQKTINGRVTRMGITIVQARILGLFHDRRMVRSENGEYSARKSLVARGYITDDLTRMYLTPAGRRIVGLALEATCKTTES